MDIQSHNHSLSMNVHSHSASTPDHFHGINVQLNDPGHGHISYYNRARVGYADSREGNGGSITRVNSFNEDGQGIQSDWRWTGISVQSASATYVSTPITVGSTTATGKIGSTGGKETRMKNLALLA